MNNDIWFLNDFDFFKILCPYKYEDHLKRYPPNTYNKNEFLFMEDEPCHEIILIDQGKVKVGHYDNAGNECVLAIMGRGDILGEMAYLGETRHREFAEVIEDNTQICKMSVAKAHELARQYVPFSIEMNRRITGHIRKLERRIEILLFKDVKLRLLEFLIDLGKESGRARDGGTYISHSLTQSDIAMLIGTSRKSASLMLNEIEDEGLIRFDRRHIFIFDIKALEKAAYNKKAMLV
ncbi:MAG: Crp/Fnr family transcriptional regulator [Lewinellaceae bacterium]|nr:Crp/Fnr family transcriptional regulator [Saprospiraceae bacterium]MCB9340184.1 Crp/Fnr family transcriptional regulator [Lewinellaceae bacterium]